MSKAWLIECLDSSNSAIRDELIPILEAMGNEAARRAFLRRTAGRDLRLFLRWLIGFEEGGRQLLDGEYGWDLCEDVQRTWDAWLRRKFTPGAPRGVQMTRNYLVARGHIKSSVITEGSSIWAMTRAHEMGGDIRLMVGSWNDDRATAFTRSIKSRIERQLAFYLLWPDLFWENPRRESDKWTESELLFKRTRPRKEANIEAHPAKSLPTQRHYEAVIWDDLVCPENVTTPEMIKYTEQQHDSALSLLEADGIELNVGTRWHYSDLNGKMIREHPSFQRRAIENGRVTFPEKYTLDALAVIERKQGPYLWNCNYLLDPVDPSRQELNPAWLIPVKREAVPLGNLLAVGVCIDPAYTKKIESDYSAVAAVGRDWQGRWWIIGGFRKKLLPHERPLAFLELAYELDKIWPVQWVREEASGMQNTDLHNMRVAQEQLIRERGVRRIPLLAHTKRVMTSKNDKIRELAGPLSRGEVHILESIPYVDHDGRPQDFRADITEEMIQFPLGSHDDALDALEDFTDYPMRGMEPPEAKTDFQRLEEEYLKQKDRERKLAGRGR